MAAVAIVVVTGALGAASCSHDLAGIDIGVAGRADVVEVVDAPALVTARTVATASTPADGTLASLHVSPGAYRSRTTRMISCSA
jgi:hypothetical protein